MTAEALLGFDAREMWTPTADLLHPAHRLTRFLLRDGVGKVLSADTLLWPSLFDRLLPRPGWIGPNPPFWESLTALEAAIPAGYEREHPYWIIAATGHAFGRRPEWTLLGFDVTDGSFLSGLSDCGYTDEERPALARRWAPSLNPHHLFADLAEALAFCPVSNRRVPEHAPFFAIGLWLVRGEQAADPRSLIST